MRKNIVAGNWKMNKTLQEGIALAKELNEALFETLSNFVKWILSSMHEAAFLEFSTNTA